MQLPSPLVLVVAAVVVVYDILAVIFLARDHAVVHRCHASSADVHVVWPINLWIYVVASAVVFTLGAAGLATLPLTKIVDAVRRQGKRRKRRRPAGELDDSLQQRPVRFGDDLPDWLFLTQGTALLTAATAFACLAFIGYFELFVAKPWCEDRAVAFEELDLWRFGHSTFVLQLAAACLLFVGGIASWAAPVAFELTEPVNEASPLSPGDRRQTGRSGHSGPGYP